MSIQVQPARRSLIAASAFGGAAVFAVQVAAEAVVGPGASGAGIRPFRVEFPRAALDDLRRRILATRWPARETVADATQGVQLATIQKLARY
jgi:hypothetical protein